MASLTRLNPQKSGYIGLGEKVHTARRLEIWGPTNKVRLRGL